MHRTPSAPLDRWRLVDTAPAPGAWNMALDEALAASVRAGGAPVLRFYRWEPACLSLGRNQPADGYDPDALQRAGIHVVRRPTGGRAVLHDRELTYAVAVADGALGTPRDAYRAINGALVAGLRALGADVALHAGGEARAPRPSLEPCFAVPVADEVVAAGAKLVGSAQRRSGGVLLQHGSLPIHADAGDLGALLREPWTAPGSPSPATLAGVLGRVPAWAELTAAIAGGWRSTLGVELDADAPTDDELRSAAGLRPGFEDAAWTWHASPPLARVAAGGGEPWTTMGEGTG
jgi:lipoyl(octanoyl) transferase